MIKKMALAVVAALPFSALAQGKADGAADYPNKPVRWVVPFPPGASNDVIGRLLAGKLTDALGQQFVVDNRGGAGGLIGAETVVRAPPDGYTLLLANPAPSVNSPLMAKAPPYKANEFTNVVYIGYAPLILVTHLNFGPRTVKDLVEFARANPDKVVWGSSGVGSSLHIGMAVFQASAQVRFTHVPYKGAAPMITEVVGGSLNGSHTTTVTAEAVIKGKRVRVIGIASPKRSPLLPDVPTLAESGFKDAESLVWFGMSAPLKTPRAIVNKLNREVNRALGQADVKARLDQLGLEVQGGTPEDMDKFVNGEIAKLNRLIKLGYLKVE